MTEHTKEFDPMAHEELHDKGPWEVGRFGRFIYSDDFTHDVRLRVDGDFYNTEQQKAYSENLAAKLNAPAGVAIRELALRQVMEVMRTRITERHGYDKHGDLDAIPALKGRAAFGPSRLNAVLATA